MNKVSVITVTYNCANDIEATIQSVVSQDYPNLEYIIIDGGSTDGTLNVIRQYEGIITKWISEPDKGIYDAMNKGIAMSTGEWINFMNAGDTFKSKDVISKLMAHVTPAIKVLYGMTDYIFRDATIKPGVTSELNKLGWTIGRHQPYCHQSVFYNTEDKKMLYFDTQYSIQADYDVSCRFWKRYNISNYMFVPVVVCNYKAFDGLSSIKLKESFSERLRIKIRHHLSIIEIVKDIVRYVFKLY